MRNIISSIVLFITISLGVYAQTPIPDGGFENCWVENTADKGKYWDFDESYFFTTLNELYGMLPTLGDGPLTAFRETDANDGNYALRLVSEELNATMKPDPIFLPGAMGNLKVDILGMDCSLGKPFTSRPTAIKGFHKYVPVNGDSAAIEIVLKKNGAVIGSGKQVITNEVSNWSQFSVPVNYSSNDTPDTIIIVFSASAKYDFTDITTLMACEGQVGSTLYLDDIELDYTEPENIPDGGFETCWTTKQGIVGVEYDDFSDNYFFNSLNLLNRIGAPFTAIKESTYPHNGNYALKLVSGKIMSSIFLPGAMGNITVDVNAMDVSLGRPFTSRPTGIIGWYKYEPVAGDSAAIEIWLEKNGTILGKGKQVINNEVSSWDQFNVPITYTSDDTPDKIIILFVSSAKYDFSRGLDGLTECDGQEGSALFLDDLELDYLVSGIREMLNPKIKMSVYPNPSKDAITVQVAKETQGTVIVYDYLARKIGEYPINGTQIKIDVQNYAQGSYLLNVIENNKVITTSRFVKE